MRQIGDPDPDTFNDTFPRLAHWLEGRPAEAGREAGRGSAPPLVALPTTTACHVKRWPPNVSDTPFPDASPGASRVNV